VQAQTVKCQHLIGVDEQMQGAGFVRNVLLSKVTTPYVTFLDADDYLEPNFAELTLSAIKPHSYVYTAWFSPPYTGEHATKVERGYYHNTDEHVNIPHPPRDVWRVGFHLITSVISIEDARRAGGFDPYMRGMEDTDFWLKCLTDLCLCPIRVDTPLVHYTKHGIRSHAIIKSGENNVIRSRLLERYGNKMPCCGGVERTAYNTIGQKLEGDVLIQAQWGGNRNYRGKVSNRLYGRLSYPKQFWGSREDVQADLRNLKIIDTGFVVPATDFSDEDVTIIDSADENPLMTIAKMMGMSTIPSSKTGGTVQADTSGVVKKARAKKTTQDK
jgi:glycosyltransferase involved in cell wall biosynthesis